MGLNAQLLATDPGDIRRIPAINAAEAVNVKDVMEGAASPSVGYLENEIVMFCEHWDFSSPDGTGLAVSREGLLVPNLAKLPFALGQAGVKKVGSGFNARYDYDARHEQLQNTGKLPVHQIIGHRPEDCEASVFPILGDYRALNASMKFARRLLEPENLVAFVDYYQARIRMPDWPLCTWTPGRIGAHILANRDRFENANKPSKAKKEQERYDRMCADLARVLEAVAEYRQRLAAGKDRRLALETGTFTDPRAEREALRQRLAELDAEEQRGQQEAAAVTTAPDPRLRTVQTFRDALPRLTVVADVLALLDQERQGAARPTVLNALTSRHAALTAKRDTTPKPTDAEVLEASADELRKLKDPTST